MNVCGAFVQIKSLPRVIENVLQIAKLVHLEHCQSFDLLKFLGALVQHRIRVAKGRFIWRSHADDG